jgi:hypothetical protein
MTTAFENKRILLIAPNYFGYDQEIKKKLEGLGAKVDFIFDRPFSTPILKAVTRLRRELILPFADRFFEEQLDRLASTSYDMVFVIQGEGLSPKVLQLIRTRFPQASLTLYMWDSFRNKPNLVGNIKYFDRCFSFDSKDCTTYGMQFRPLFFNDGFDSPQVEETRYDVSFIGTAHSDRYSIVKNLHQALPTNSKTYFYLYLQAKWYYHYQKLTNSGMSGSKINDFEFIPLKKTQVQEVFAQSFSILDIEHPDQIGLTMRTFETLGAQKKLITTNAAVVEYDFYNPNNIFVVQREKSLKIPSAFFGTPATHLPEHLYKKYSVAGWLQEVLVA